MRITSKGQVSIPVEIREQAGLLPDTEVEFEFDGTSVRIRRAADEGALVINPLIYAEVSIGYARIEDVEAALADGFRRDPLPWEAAFLAGKCFADYGRHGGDRRSPLADFYIGAHAAVAGIRLLTLDAACYLP